jgi:hypothetical protein
LLSAEKSVLSIPSARFLTQTFNTVASPPSDGLGSRPAGVAMSRGSSLRVESLESRDTPARFGTPWPDGQHLTLSLAPDGTPIAGNGSNLAALLAQLGPGARMDVLRAFQNWVVNANVNVGLVSDDGSAFGTGGPPQGDPRFGDIRVGGLALPSDVLAVTAPFNYYDDYSGDVVVNTAANFGYTPNKYDLFTALLQESGHSLGIGNSPDPASVMYEYYLGPRAGLSAADVASVQQLYGARVPDQYEGTAGNDTLQTATRYPGTVTADLTTPSDVDTYRFTTGLLTTGTTISLRAAGLSLVAARVELLDANGNVVASAAATDPTANNVTLSAQVRGLSTYYVRVSAARSDVFGVGAYTLDVDPNSILSGTISSAVNLLQETGLNDTLLTATTLLSSAVSVGPQTEYNGSAAFGSRSDVDYYRITVPPSANGQPVNLVTTVWGQNGAALNAWVEVQDLFGHPLAGEVITADGGTTTIQVRGLVPGGTYFLRMSSDTGSVGGYRFSADLRADPVAVPHNGSGTLSATHAADAATLHLAQSGQVHFLLSASGASGAAAELVVTTLDGTTVADVSAVAGRGRSIDVFLPAGSYRVTVRSSGSVPDVAYSLGVALITDPVGPPASDPTRSTDDSSTSPPPPPPPPPPDSGTWWTTDYTTDDPQWY